MKIKTAKMISLILALSVLMSCFTTVTIRAAALESKNGFLDIEAEKTAYTKTNLTVSSNKMFSAGQALAVGTEDKTQPTVNATPDIDLSFKADKAGTYTIWLRSTGMQDGSGNSIFLSISGAEYAYAKIPGEIDSPLWGVIGKVTVGEAGTVAAVKIKTRQAYHIALDRFIITNDAAYLPDDSKLGITTPPPTTTVTPAPTTVAKPTLTTKDGSLVLEAEALPYNQKNFEITTNKDASGGKGLGITNEDKTVPLKTDKSDIDLSFVADKTGTYAVWVRNTATPENSSGNSAFISLNNGDYAYTVLAGTPTEFAWTKLGVVTVSAGGIGSVRLTRRQKYGIVLDKFIITSNKLFIPKDMGGDPNTVSEMKLPDNVYPKPSVTPPAEHPRLMFTKQDIPTIKANFETEQNKAAYDAWQKSLTLTINSNLPNPSKSGASNMNIAYQGAIEALAFDYAINGNEESGKKAIEHIKNYASTATYDNSTGLAYRSRGFVIFSIAEVYDWCYPLLSAEDKKTLIVLAESIASDLDIGYPPSKQGAVTGHGGETSLLRDLLSLGIATYNERPDIYNYCAGRILAEHVPTRDFLYTANMHTQGNAYGDWRGTCEIWSAWLFKRMSGQDVYSKDQQYFPYGWLYSRRPDGQAFRIGDDYWEAGGKGTYWSGWSVTLFMVANYYNDPYLKREYAREAPLMAGFSLSFNTLSPVTLLALNNPSLEGKPTTQLPLSKYFPSPTGMMVARTGWSDGKTAPDAMALMNIGEKWPANHAHLDAGSFQLYYKGILASESGDYSDGYGTDHAINYDKRSIANNTLTIYDPNEKTTYYGKPVANDGGQRSPNNAGEAATLKQWLDPVYDTGKVLDREFGPDPMKPEYTYIKGDITKAYSDKVSSVFRSMVFMPLEDADHPAVMIVMDKVDAKSADFKKSWLLHTQEEPTIEGNKTIVTRTTKDYNGRMVVETLLPKNAKIEKIGGEGKQFWIDGKNYPPASPDSPSSDSEGVAWGRIEVSPSAAAQTDLFLNVMTVSDADTKAADLASTLIEGDNFVGAVISDRVALFGKDASRMDKEVKFTIPGTGDFKVFVSGIKEGTWATADGQTVIVSADGGAAYFNAKAGEVVLTYKDAAATKPAIQLVVDENDSVGIRINKAFIYSDVKPVVIQDRTLIPMRVIFENLGATVTYDDATKTATATKDGLEIKITEDSTTAYVDGAAQELDVPATVVNDRFVVPVRFVSEALGAKVTWDPFANLVDILPGAPKPAPMPEGYAKIVSSKADAVSEAFYAENSWDNNYDTLWSAEGEHYVVYEFDKNYTVSWVELILNQNAGRDAVFEVQYSADGTNFTSIYSGKGDGTVGDNKFEKFVFSKPVEAKYMKYIAKGSNKSMWNGLKEIRFKVN